MRGSLNIHLRSETEGNRVQESEMRRLILSVIWLIRIGALLLERLVLARLEEA